ncbi:MAG: hypothetical protein LBE12_07600 [Planctomycetaceae bacterium]|jgi:hypothetical protein|nr:hypothetical protein [Planctomycetaceae bacterium]
MKTFLFPFVFAAVVFGLTVSVSADTTLFDWEDPGNAIVFATELATFSKASPDQWVEIDYAIKDNVLYSRITKVADTPASNLGFTDLHIFAGAQRADGYPEGTGSDFFSVSNESFWGEYENAVLNDAMRFVELMSDKTYDLVTTSVLDTNYLIDRTKNNFQTVSTEYAENLNEVYMTAINSSAYYMVQDGEILLSQTQAYEGYQGYDGTTTDIDAVYNDGIFTISANGNFLFSFSYSNMNDYIEYAINLDGIGSGLGDDFHGIHIGSQREGYYTFLELPSTSIIAGTPEPATALILGFAGGIAIPLLRRKTKKAQK